MAAHSSHERHTPTPIQPASNAQTNTSTHGVHDPWPHTAAMSATLPLQPSQPTTHTHTPVRMASTTHGRTQLPCAAMSATLPLQPSQPARHTHIHTHTHSHTHSPVRTASTTHGRTQPPCAGVDSTLLCEWEPCALLKMRGVKEWDHSPPQNPTPHSVRLRPQP